VARGFAILFANLRVGSLEIDLVAQKGPLVVVVEVRTRGPGSLTSALESITPAKRARLLRATDRLWREKLSTRGDVERIRIDVAAVTLEDAETSVEYVEGAIVGG
jgi:putative endonuclease